MRWKSVFPVVLLFAIVGCNSPSKPEPSSHATAAQKWNVARAGVLGSLATEQYKGGNLDKARGTVDQAMTMDPQNAALRVLSAKIAIEQSQLDLAEKELRRAQLMDARNAEADYLCGMVYQRWQKADTAYNLYMTAASKAPTELAYTLAAAEMLVDMDRSDEALNMLMSKTEAFEHNAVIRDTVGQLLVGKGRYAEAIQMFRQASMLATDDDSIKEHMALALYFNKQYRESADVLVRLTADEKYKQRVDLYLALGECYANTGKQAEAKATYEAATQVSPGTAEAWTGLARISLERNDTRRAETSLRKAISLDPAASEPQLLLGYLRVRQNRLSDALPLFKKASALNQSDTVSLCMIGYVYEKTGKSELAIQCYAKALKIRPGDELATKLLASLETNQ